MKRMISMIVAVGAVLLFLTAGVAHAAYPVQQLSPQKPLVFCDTALFSADEGNYAMTISFDREQSRYKRIFIGTLLTGCSFDKLKTFSDGYDGIPYPPELAIVKNTIADQRIVLEQIATTTFPVATTLTYVDATCAAAPLNAQKIICIEKVWNDTSALKVDTVRDHLSSTPKMSLSFFLLTPVDVESPRILIDTLLVNGAARNDGDEDGIPDALDPCPEEFNNPDNLLLCAPTLAPPPADPSQIDDDGDEVINADDECPGTEAGVEVDAKGCPVVVEEEKEEEKEMEEVVEEPATFPPITGLDDGATYPAEGEGGFCSLLPTGSFGVGSLTPFLAALALALCKRRRS